MLPGRDGLSVLRQWRQQHNVTPALLLSARGEVTERVEGLDAERTIICPNRSPGRVDRAVARLNASGRKVLRLASLRVSDPTLDTVTHRPQPDGLDIELTARIKTM